jgi:pSer/pThr/pTyr-binding forkhead associated (FHA) protein
MLPGEVPRQRVRAPAVLALLSGNQASRLYPLADAEATVGRAETSSVVLSDPGVSRHHARVVREGDDFIIEDLRSTNGTEVNGRPIVRRRLADGDVIRVGNTTLRFQRED